MSRTGMSRTGMQVCDDLYEQKDILAYGRWRGAVKSAMNGKKGQAFLKELLAALKAMPEKKLIDDVLMDAESGNVCAIGQVMVARKMSRDAILDIDYADYEGIADMLGVNEKIVQEVEWENDQNAGNRRFFKMNSEGKADYSFYYCPYKRWTDVVDWVKAHIKDERAEVS